MKALVDMVKQRGPISRAELAKRLKMRERDVHATIAALNMVGVPIVFTGKGFYWAKTNAQKAHCIHTLKKSAKSLLRRAAGLEKRDLDAVTRELFT